MRITINNGDGLGAVEYTRFVCQDGPVTLERALNVPSRCTMSLLCVADGVAVPRRGARAVVTSDAGALLFTGYLATEPMQVYAGEGMTGPVYQTRVNAVSDEWLLDRSSSGVSSLGLTALRSDGATVLTQLTTYAQAGASTLQVANGEATPRVLGAVQLAPDQPWSANARALASAAYAGYRGLNGVVTFAPAANVTHALSDSAGTLQPADLQLSALRELANDVTLSGEEEPDAFISESFLGDGTTAAFPLREAAFRGRNRTLANDSFSGSVLDAGTWQSSDPAGALSITSAGLTVAGGTGSDGQTFIRGVGQVELGGAVLAELSGVTLGAQCSGMLAGFYADTPVLANCIAGMRVRQNAGATVMVPVVNGAEAGTLFTPVSGHTYTVRVRLYCVEMLRVGQPYFCMVDGVVESFGSAAGVDAPLQFVFDVVDEGASSNTPATVLYDSAATGTALSGLAAVGSFVPLNAELMTASVGAVRLTQPGSLWVVSTLPNGTQQTRLMGSAGQGVDCEVRYGSAAGVEAQVSFFSGRVPVVNERVTVHYRTSRRAVARLQDAASIAAEASGGLSGVRRWVGKALAPAARSSADCESAAQALLAFATSRTAALRGSYSVINPAADIWPGDLLAMTADGATTPLLVRRVTVADGHAVPEVLQYTVSFANDWATELADGLGLRLSDEIAGDALLPATAAAGPAEVLANLQQLSLTSLSTSALTIDARCDPPSGGGFEVRRRDGLFGATVDPGDLVLRSPVRTFTLPRATASEQFYVRMYDASTPPLYSRVSSAVFVNAPVG